MLGLVASVQGLDQCDGLLLDLKHLSCCRPSRATGAWILPLRTLALLCEFDLLSGVCRLRLGSKNRY